MSEQLDGLTRDELNARASQLGIDAAGLPNKAAVIEAIEKAGAASAGTTGPRSLTARRARLLRTRRARGQL